jgi:hypothetical protein
MVANIRIEASSERSRGLGAKTRQAITRRARRDVGMIITQAYTNQALGMALLGIEYSRASWQYITGLHKHVSCEQHFHLSTLVPLAKHILGLQASWQAVVQIQTFINVKYPAHPSLGTLAHDCFSHSATFYHMTRCSETPESKMQV